MAIAHNIAPQAYTRDVLVKAIDWVSTQPASVRERAASADALVSLYLQARRRPDWQPEPVVAAPAPDFSSELKNLARDMNPFEDLAAPNAEQMPLTFAQPTPPPPAREPVEEFRLQPPPAIAAPVVAPPPPVSKSLSAILDNRTISATKEIQARLNLSSENEALRFLVTLGLERARQLFP